MKTILWAALAAILGVAGCQKPAAERRQETAQAKPGIVIEGLRYVTQAAFYGGADIGLTLEVFDAEGNPVASQASGQLIMPAMGAMPEMRARIPFGEAAASHAARFTLEMGGKWFATLHVRAGGKHVMLHYALNTVSKQWVFERSQPPAGSSGGEQEESAGDEDGTPRVYIPEARRQLIGVTFAPVEHRNLTQTVRAFGRVAVNEQSISAVNLQVGGWARKVFVKDAGARVKRGDPLFILESPALRAAQEEYRISLDSGDAALIAAVEGKLRTLGMQQRDVEALRGAGAPSGEVIVRSPRDGFVISKSIVEGERVEAGATAFRVGNLGRVWILADVFESDAPLVREGQKATVRLRGAPEPVAAEVSYVYPAVDEKNRTLPVRLEVTNAAETLKPGMAVDVSIEANLGHAVAVPRSAVLVSGEHRYVFVDQGDGYLEPREIRTAGGNGEWIQVAAGLQTGERVSTSANFLISSEAALQNALPKWGGKVSAEGNDAPPAEEPAEMHHHHH